MRLIIIVLCIALFPIFSNAQESISYPNVNIETYNQYLKAEWYELIKTGKKALKNDIDFYYLQVRMGIAYYELKKYRKAIAYFENARSQNADDELIKEYLYYSYLFSGRVDDSRKFSILLSEDLKKKIGIKENPVFNSIYLETKFDNSEDYLIGTVSGQLLNQDVRKKLSYYSVNFEHLIQNDKKIIWGYTGINILNNSYEVRNFNQYQYDKNVFQNQLYFKYGKQKGYGFKFNMALNIALISSDELVLEQNRFGMGGVGISFVVQKQLSGAFVGFLSVEKDIKYFKLELLSSFSAINSRTQIQPGLDIYFYPFGNNNLYTISSFNNQFDFGSDETKTEFVYSQSLGFRIYKFYFEPSITIGNIKNYVKNDAFVLYNGDDIIKDMKSVKIYTDLFKKRISFFAKYENYIKTNEYRINGIDYQKEYNCNSIIGGIKWIF